MQWKTTDILAWWGAIVATLVLVWDIIKWRKDRVNLSVKIYGIGFSDVEGIRCEISNRGGKATTIIEVMLVTYQDNPFFRLIRMSKSIRNLSVSAPEMNLPYPLAPGTVWSRTFIFSKNDTRSLNDENYSKLIEQGKLFYKVRLSHCDRCIRGRVKPEGITDLFG